KFLAHIVGVPGEVRAQLLEFLAELALLRGHESDRRLGVGMRWDGRIACRNGCLGRRCRSMTAPVRAGETRAHDRLVDLGVAADRAAHQAARPLLVVSGRVLEPALEGVSLRAGERIADHRSAPAAYRSPPAAWSGVGSAIGCTISNRR